MGDVQRDLVRAAKETLRPSVERLLKIGVPFGVLQLSVRELFIRVAQSKLGPVGKRQTDSQVALVTGINRKEVKRIRASRTPRRAPRSFSINQATSLISRWMNDTETTDVRGRPIPLPYNAKRGPSFMKIARKLTGDLAPGVLLDELVRSGAVEMRKDEMLVLRGNAYVPKVAEGGLRILAEDSAELADTILRNVFAEAPKRLLQRKVFYDNLGSAAANRIRAEMRREGERFLRRIDRLLSRYDRDRNPRAPAGDRMYAALGIYFFESRYEEKRELLEAISDSKGGQQEKTQMSVITRCLPLTLLLLVTWSCGALDGGSRAPASRLQSRVPCRRCRTHLIKRAPCKASGLVSKATMQRASRTRWASSKCRGNFRDI